MRKKLIDIKKEFGFILRWVNPDSSDGIEYKGRYYLEDYKTGEEIKIEDEKIIDFIKSKKVVAFRDGLNFDYEAYVELFNMLGIKPHEKFNKTQYDIEFNRKNYRRVEIRLNINTEKHLIEHLEKQPNKQGYIKSLIEKDATS
jgi:hypothetical protein